MKRNRVVVAVLALTLLVLALPLTSQAADPRYSPGLLSRSTSMTTVRARRSWRATASLRWMPTRSRSTA